MPDELYDELITDPLKVHNGLTLTPFHILTLALASLALILTNLPSPFTPYARPLTRISILLLLLLLAHHLLLALLASHQAHLAKAHRELRSRFDPLAAGRIGKLPHDWEHAAAHPSHFLTTRDAKPRLFPFPLGHAGAGGAGGAAGKELWWEAGNSAHIGHFNQRDTPAARSQHLLEMQAKEKARQTAAKKRIDEYSATRKKWITRLTHLKVVMGIVVVGLFSKPAGVGCLCAWIYYLIATHLAGVLFLKPAEEEKPAKARKKIPTTPGMAMTYLYEPDGEGVAPAGAIPTKAPSHRLTTSFQTRYAS